MKGCLRLPPVWCKVLVVVWGLDPSCPVLFTAVFLVWSPSSGGGKGGQPYNLALISSFSRLRACISSSFLYRISTISYCKAAGMAMWSFTIVKSSCLWSCTLLLVDTMEAFVESPYRPHNRRQLFLTKSICFNNSPLIPTSTTTSRSLVSNSQYEWGRYLQNALRCQSQFSYIRDYSLLYQKDVPFSLMIPCYL